MKVFKKYLFIVLILFSFYLTGCFKNDVKENINEITLKLGEDFEKYMTYYEEIPNFVLSFEGSINTISNTPKSEYVIFASNDDFRLSMILSELFEKCKDNITYIVETTKQAETTNMNTYVDSKLIKKKMLVDNNEVFYEVAYIALENGLKLTLDYRHFKSDNIDYYTWRETNNISMNLYYPLMVIKENDKKELLLLTLPNMVKYQVGTTLQINNIMKDDTYVDTNKFVEEDKMCGKYTLNYYEGEMSKEEQQKYIKDYYLNNPTYNAYFENYIVKRNGENVEKEFLLFTYLDVLYSIEFFSSQFTIRYEKKLLQK